MLLFDAKDLEKINRVLDVLAKRPKTDLLMVMGETVLDQTRRRIDDEKRDPAGRPWAAWSEKYAETRTAGQSLLQSEGQLLESLQTVVGRARVSVGSDLIYAASQQFSQPEREFLGLSGDNERELLLAMGEQFEREIQRVL